MTDHEMLLWVAFCNEGYAAQHNSLPTLSEQIRNLRDYSGSRAVQEFKQRVPVLHKKGLLAIDHCQPHCTAEHVLILPEGRRLLKLWNAEGCQVHRKEHTGYARPRNCNDFIDRIRRKISRERATEVRLQ